MTHFIKKISLYLLPIVILAIGLEIYVESIPNSYTYKRQYMELHASEIQTLVLGSSYAYDGIDAEVLPNAFNLANSSQCFEDDYRLLQRYIIYMDSLQTVILPLSYSSLQMVSSSNRRGYYSIYMDLYPRWPISKYSFECFNLELMTKKIIKHTLRADVVRCDSHGQRIGHTLDTRPADWQDTEKLVANDSFVGSAAQPYIKENTYWLRRIALECQVSGVELYLLKMPALQDYRDAMPHEQVEAMNHAITTIANKFDCVHILDYQDWGTDADFWNATHLNTYGAQRITENLNKIFEK